MATAPEFQLFDESGFTTDLTITTNLFGIILKGRVGDNTIDVQININGEGFVSDPSLVDLNPPEFTIPNLSSFPMGLELEKGVNTVEIRAIDISGSVSATSTAIITVVSSDDLILLPEPPTGLSINRNASSIELRWNRGDLAQRLSDEPVTGISGFNVYSSTGAGGTGSGFLRVNKDLLPISNPTETIVEEIDPIEIEYNFQDNTVAGIPDAESVGNDFRVVTELRDRTTGEFLRRIGQNEFSLVDRPISRFKAQIFQLFENEVFSFIHNRNDGVQKGILNNDVFSVVSSDEPLSYVITTILFDPDSGSLVESRFSEELIGAPLPLDTTVRGIRIRDRRQVTRGYIGEVQKAQPTLALIPGSTIRELHIEPFSNEIQKAYFLMDFVHRAKSFAALLQIDDPQLTGISIPVENSTYKQSLKSAIGLENDGAVQQLIDGAFDSLAENFSRMREGNRPAVVSQTFYTTTRPTEDLIVNQNAVVASSDNATAPRFRSSSQVVIFSDNPDAFFNAATSRFEVKVQMVAETPGEIGNVPAKVLDTVVAGADGLLTENTEAADFGRDEQTNVDVAASAGRALVALDTGTGGGYRDIAISTPGVIETRIVKSGDPCMMRDWDDVRKKHIGGKVDIWIKGTSQRTVTESFAFQFTIARSVRFNVIDPINLIFRARDSRLSEDNPIAEMLFNPAQNLGLRNQSLSPTESYDLTGVILVDFRTIQLSTTLSQPTTTFDDFVEGDYRFRSNNKFTPSLQPIISVTSVTGEVSGSLDAAAGFTLFKVQDPLLDGESTISKDFVEINQVDGIPTGNPIAVNAEQHVLIGQFEERLGAVGINEFSVHVFNANRDREFNGPDSVNPDYLIVGGSQTEPVQIVRSVASAIASGETVSIDYEHDENFNVVYVINDTMQKVQKRINEKKHITADVIVKQSVENPLAIESTVQLKPNAEQSRVDSALRTSYTDLTNSKGVGGDIHISDVVSVIDNTDGVDFVVQPFARFTLRDGALRVREPIDNDADELTTLNQFANKVFILTQALQFNTINLGGPENLHHGVFKDELIMVESITLADVGVAPDQAFIIGAAGASIEGFSDDATLTAAGVEPNDLEDERKELTANKVVISVNIGTEPPDDPSLHTYAASYIVNNDLGPKDIEISDVEFLTPGDLTITFKRV